MADPGLVASRSLIVDPLAALDVTPADVTHVFLSHHHPDHAVNAAMFPNARVVDCWARYKDDLWLDHSGDGWQLVAERDALADARPLERGRDAGRRADDGPGR